MVHYMYKVLRGVCPPQIRTILYWLSIISIHFGTTAKYNKIIFSSKVGYTLNGRSTRKD